MDDTTGPGPTSASSSLVESEGVNAGSREVTGSGGARGDVTSGGSPERAEEQDVERPPEGEMLGSADAQEGGPGQTLAAGEG